MTEVTFRVSKRELRKFKSGEWECYRAYIEGDGGEILASLGGIILGRNQANDRRVYNAELVLEAIASLKKGEAV